jgi:transketolase C-terminal domain/subunit
MDLTWERMDRLTRAVYKLDFEKTAEWLFQEGEDLCLVDEATMITYGVEAIDGIKKDEFKVGILNKKTCF